MAISNRPKNWVINRDKDTDSIFDLYINLSLARSKASKVLGELKIIEKEIDYKRSLLWKDIENHLQVDGMNLCINTTKTDFDKIIVEESREGNEPPELLKRLLSGLL